MNRCRHESSGIPGFDGFLYHKYVKNLILTVFMIEHHMDVVMGICQRIYVLDYGSIWRKAVPRKYKIMRRSLGPIWGRGYRCLRSKIYRFIMVVSIALKGLAGSAGQQIITLVGAMEQEKHYPEVDMQSGSCGIGQSSV
jgi:energy-coupling factor transporter ATP-binding protein EcfA2